jgi:hypothetical protein
MGKHPFPTEAASATGSDTGDEHFVAFLEAKDTRPHFFDDPDPLMTKDPTVSYIRQIPF